MSIMEGFRRFNPAVPKRWLLLLAGLVWMGVGTFLCMRAAGWLSASNAPETPVLAFLGLMLALSAGRFMLWKAANRNIRRISMLPDRSCLFAFTAWRGYGMIGIMILLGTVMRHSAVPKPYLAVVYVGMGGALVLSSFLFYRSFRQSS